MNTTAEKISTTKQQLEVVANSSQTRSRAAAEHRSTPVVRSLVAILLGVCLVASLMRMPYLFQGMPYFEREDEAHHYNRIVRMMQSGDLNPHYFHKPSLHFYLRLPFTAAGFLQTVSRGQAKKVEDIKTKDPSGIAGYAFTASHPTLVKWNRAVSVLLSVGTVFLAGLIAYLLCGSRIGAALAAALAALSPSLVAESAVIGVDVPMTFFCLAASAAALRYLQAPTSGWATTCGILAGLAISSKYNALPIALVPLVACVRSLETRPLDLLRAFAAIVIGFFAASPFILVSIPQFLNQFAYEIWHYGVAGHVGHSAEPGLQQAFFYLSWMFGSALGAGAVIASLLGAVMLVFSRKKGALTFLLFPVLFFWMMSLQRANFTRNMLVFLPYAAICAGVALAWLYQKSRESRSLGLLIVTGLLTSVTIGQPALQSASASLNVAGASQDSRSIVYDWLHHNLLDKQIALDGELWLPQFVRYQSGDRILSRGGVTRLHDGLPGLQQLWLAGYDAVVMSTREYNALSELTRSLVEVVLDIPGETAEQRIINNPAVKVLQFRSEKLRTFPTNIAAPVADITENEARCTLGDQQDLCWINQKLNVVTTADESTSLTFEVMSPWPNQALSFRKGTRIKEISLDAAPGTWQRITLDTSVFPETAEPLLMEIAIIKSPLAEGVSEDRRRLGVALR